MSDAESIDLEPEEYEDVEEDKWKSTSSGRSSTSSSPDPTEGVEVPEGSPLYRWIDAELLSFLHRTIVTSRSAADDDDSEDSASGRYSQTMQAAESVVDVMLPGEESHVIKGALRTYDLSTQNLSYKVHLIQSILCLTHRSSTVIGLWTVC